MSLLALLIPAGLRKIAIYGWAIYIQDSQERYRSGRNGVDSKSICPVNSGARGFESHPLRQNLNVILLNFFRHRQNRIPDKFCRSKRIYGEMSELAEGARLEIACTTDSGTEGSNPSLSAIVIFERYIYAI